MVSMQEAVKMAMLYIGSSPQGESCAAAVLSELARAISSGFVFSIPSAKLATSH